MIVPDGVKGTLQNGIRFLHNEARMSHENIRRAVVVTEAGDWKLAGFDRSVEFR